MKFFQRKRYQAYPAITALSPALQAAREHGTIAVVWSGMDSDGNNFYGDVRYIACSEDAYRKHIDSVRAQCKHAVPELAKPSEARRIPFVCEVM